ncbi:MAG: LysM peptidoglycan-binding domain-containing protein [Lautropia sp.]|nr:LysM peptidoglycan-binding domain-containing protein [Lautropia sp.]
MKTFSTQALRTLSLSIALAMSSLVVPQAGHAQPRHDDIKLAANAPDRYTVVKGDTLWGIAGHFLQQPWRWPEIWQLNKEDIRNPHLIYPGDIVYLDRSGSTPRLRLGRSLNTDGAASASGRSGSPRGVSRLEPTVRVTSLDNAIPTIALGSIQAFINRPLIVEQNQLKSAPRILATQEGRVNLGQGDRAYVRGLAADESTKNWHVYRPARPLLDPDTRKPLAFEAQYLGTVNLIRSGDPATVEVIRLNEEMTEGDRLVAAQDDQNFNFVPRAPEDGITVNAKIVSVYRGITQVGRNSVVAINQGRVHGLDNGHVLKIEQKGRVVRDRETRENVQLPNEEVGQLLIFRTFDQVSYGLVVSAAKPVSVGDLILNP